MLLPDNLHPELSIYYNGAFVLQTVRKYPVVDFLELYMETRQVCEMSIPVFVLCLDWLFLIGQVSVNQKGRVELCS
jgi:hypothetical protein